MLFVKTTEDNIYHFHFIRQGCICILCWLPNMYWLI